MNGEIIKKAGEIIKGDSGEESWCTLALIDENGDPTASTITVSKSDGIKWLTFCTGLTSNKAKRIEKCSRACVCFNRKGSYNIALTGMIEIVTDAAVKQEMWYGGLTNHFSGPDDPNYCVLRFKTERYNLMIDWQEVSGMLVDKER